MRNHAMHDRRSMSAMQTVTTIVALGFLIVGILGFIPGVTTDYDQLQFAGHESGAMLFGVFEVSVLHNIVHLLFGVIGLAMTRTWSSARLYLVGGGIIYLALWIYGLAVDPADSANLVPLNDADNWLHLGLGVAMIVLGIVLSAEHRINEPDRRPRREDERYSPGVAAGRETREERQARRAERRSSMP
jgi:hypothetical protein